MPSQTLKSLASRAGVSANKAERYWEDAKKQARKQNIYKKDDEDRYYKYVMGIVKRRLESADADDGA